MRDEYSALILSGNPDPQELADAWKNILTEYTEAVGTAEYLMFLNVYREYEMMKCDFKTITEILIPGLRVFYSKVFADDLNRMLRMSCTFNPLDWKTFQVEVEKCNGRIGSVELKLKIKQAEYETLKSKINSSGEEGSPIDQNYFTTVLVILSRFSGYSIKKDIFVNEYTAHLNDLRDHNKAVKRAFKK